MNDDLEILLGKAVAGELSPEEADRLAEVLRANKELADEYQKDQRFSALMHAALRNDTDRFERGLLARIQSPQETERFINALESKLPKPGAKRFGFRSHRVALLAASAALLALCVFVSLSIFYNPSSQHPVVSAIEGTAQLAANGNPTAVAVGQALKPNQKLSTLASSTLELRFPDGTTLKVYELARLEVTRDDSTKSIFLSQGRLDAQVSPRKIGSVFSVATPHSLVEVTGTRFSVATGAQDTLAEVVEGRVQFTRDSDKASLQLVAGEFAYCDATKPFAAQKVGEDTAALMNLILGGKPAHSVKTYSPALLTELKLQNESMTQGNALPAAWDQQWFSKGTIKSSRDATVYKSAPASLRIESVGGPATGQVFQRLPAQGGLRLRMEGVIKCAGKAKVSAGIQPYFSDGRAQTFLQLKFVMNDQDWTSFSGEALLPSYTATIGVALFLEGEGQAWLDDVKLHIVK